MKDTIKDANFPKTADGRCYHLGVRHGEVANRIITVGSPSRAKAIAAFLDATPALFTLASERGFLTLTGRYKGTPISIVSIGMGSPNMDFFVREMRESVSGDMIIVRLGSCGALIDVPVGSVVVPKASVAITRNYDYDFVNEASNEEPYRLSKPVAADAELHHAIHQALDAARPVNSNTAVIAGTVNASADSFYGSQGRLTSFPDHNSGLIEQIKTSTDEVATLEMETFHLFHLAACWGPPRSRSARSSPPPLATGPVVPVLGSSATVGEPKDGVNADTATAPSVIRAAAAQMVFASRTSQDFITPAQVAELEDWTGKAVLEAMSAFKVDSVRIHEDTGSVWELKQ